MARATLVDLSPDVYNQGCRYYSSIVSLNRCNGGFNGGFNRSIMCVWNKTENVNMNAFNITARINELTHYWPHSEEIGLYLPNLNFLLHVWPLSHASKKFSCGALGK